MSAVPREVIIPYCPRVWARQMHASYKRFLVTVLHRRAGKTTAILNHHQRAAIDDQWEKTRLNSLNPSFSIADLHRLLKNRTYWHGMPTAAQARLTGAWDLLKDISRGIPAIRTNETYMSVRYPNGSKLQIVGLDDPDAKRGPGLSGLSLDEYSQIPPHAFGEVLSKSLADHLGYTIFSGTIKGKDQLYKTYQAGKSNPDWFALWQDVDVSLATETGATITALRTAMEDDRKLVMGGLMTQAEFDQEWYLSVDAAIKGAFYAAQLKQIRQQGQICRVPHDPALPVDTDWDLGIDAMAIWFSQSTRMGEVRLIDYYEDIGGGLELAIKAIKGQLPNPTNDAKLTAGNARRATYTYGKHWAPHDIEVREISSGLTRRQIAASQGLRFEVTPKIEVADGITAVQLILPRCWFDDGNTERGREGLAHYRKTWNQRLAEFTATPVHDWSSHSADAFRGLAVRYRPPAPPKMPGAIGPRRVVSAYS